MSVKPVAEMDLPWNSGMWFVNNRSFIVASAPHVGGNSSYVTLGGLAVSKEKPAAYKRL